MRKAKRIVALVLALTLLFALAAMTAAAATARAVTCDRCGSGRTNFLYKTANVGNVTVSGCANVSGYHIHSRHRDQRIVRCNDCKYEVAVENGPIYEVCRG